MVRRQPGPQRALQFRLIERHQLGMPVDAAERVNPAEFSHVGGFHPDIGNGDRVKIALFQAGHLQDPQGFIIKGNGPRRREDLRCFINDERLDAVAAEQVGDHCADWPEAY